MNIFIIILSKILLFLVKKTPIYDQYVVKYRIKYQAKLNTSEKYLKILKSLVSLSSSTQGQLGFPTLVL